jgi:Cellulose biosynthesis protein BcsS
VFKLGRVVATVAAVARAVVVCAAVSPADAGEPNTPSFLLFAGTDVWRFAAFFYGGTLWSPGGLDADGFTLKVLLSAGDYMYTSGAQTDVRGTMLSAAALPGWHFARDNLSVSLFVGPTFQNYRLTPDDPGSRLRGSYVGAEFAADIWYQPTAITMAALNGMIATIGPTGSLRGAVGVRAFDAAFVGPEVREIWCGNYEEFQLGIHVTGLHFDGFEWSAGGGWSMTSDQRTGPYVRLGISGRY